MRNLIPALLLIGLLRGCITVETKTPAPPPFVTSTLPAGPAPVSTPTPSPTSPGALAPRPADCTDRAIFMQDVTVADGTRMKSGQVFTKTWQLKNLGSCPWDAKYTLAFLAGERMGAPDSVPLAVTLPGETVDISVELTAPSRDGTHTGIFELRDPAGKAIPIGLDKSIWVKIIVGSGGYIPPAATNAPGITPVKTPTLCQYSTNEGYVSQLLDLINAARREAHIPELVVNPQLTQAAQGHSADMACNNFKGHYGSDGSYIDHRIRAAGYVPAYWLEIIAFGTPQDAMNQWQASAEHWQAVLAPGIAEIGVGYAYYAQSDYGGYFTVDMGTR
jgi:uncharacterized protein YkwD